jgi:hypothetical protein
MRINTQRSIDTAKAARDKYGSWADAKSAGRGETEKHGNGSASNGNCESGAPAKR